MKNQNSITKLEENFKKFNWFIMMNSAFIILGVILQYTTPQEISYLGKSNWITGIPFLRTWYLSIPTILNVLMVVYYISFFYNNKKCNETYNKELSTFLKRLEGFKFFTNIALFIFFYVLFYKLVIPIQKIYKFKLSGHVVATLISGSILFNLFMTTQDMNKNEIGKKELNLALYYLTCFMILHNSYTIVFTAWIYHPIRETILAFLITSCYLYTINFMKIDTIVLLAFSPELPVEIESNFVNKIN